MESVTMTVEEFKATWLVVAWMRPMVEQAERESRELAVGVLASPFGRYVKSLAVA
jgi:hypothetical protein